MIIAIEREIGKWDRGFWFQGPHKLRALRYMGRILGK